MGALDAGFSNVYAMAIGDAFSEEELTPYEWAHFAHVCKLPFRLVAHELENLANSVPALLNELEPKVIGQAVPTDVVRRVRKLCH